jgi:hypothetical protein
VTTDALGNLGVSNLDLVRLGGLDGRTTALEGRTTGLEGRASALEGRASALEGRATALEQQTAVLRRQARAANGGIAAAMAMGGTIMPPDSTLAISFNLATYRGQQGFSGAIVSRVTDHIWASGGLAGSTIKGSTGGRLGMTFGW